MVFSTIFLTTIGWIAMKFRTDIPVPLRINCNHFGDPLTFNLPSLSGQRFYYIFYFILISFYSQMHAKLYFTPIYPSCIFIS